MTFDALLAEADRRPFDHELLDRLARAGLAESQEERALAHLLPLARGSDNAVLWQWSGLLQRAIDDHAAALVSFANAARLTPANRSIAHARARVALEAGIDSVALFEKAMTLGSPTGDLVLGLAAALVATGSIDRAITTLERALAASPMWIDGHAELAQLRGHAGEPERAPESLERALHEHPHERGLWFALLQLNLRSSNFAALAENASRAAAAGCGEVGEFAAIAASEMGDTDRAEVLFANASTASVWRIRHALRSGRVAEAAQIVDAMLDSGDANSAWPYAAIVWKLNGDARHDWLVGDNSFVRTYDVTSQLPPLDQLAEALRSLHARSGTFLDQSVRGGTQTSGALFSLIDPTIKRVRSAVRAAVADYVADLPPFDAAHPLLGRRRDREIRFSGSWSVRLNGAGYHESHVHPRGWISSALYVSLPDRQSGDDPRAGWLELGRPPGALDADIEPLRMIAPKPGTLVLFPSWLWHGTRPFAQGERLTIAFDVA